MTNVGTPLTLEALHLEAEELARITSLVESLAARFPDRRAPGLPRALSVECHELPRRLRVFCNDFRLQEPPSGGIVVHGYPIDDASLGPTPDGWRGARQSDEDRMYELVLGLVASLLGDLFGWATQQDGRLFHDVVPMRGLEEEQLGAGSREELLWHTEDAFDPDRCDFVGLMCLRNPTRVGTTVASIEAVQLSAEDRRKLAEPHFVHIPDDSHLPEQNSASRREDERMEASFARVERQFADPEPAPVIYGDLDHPYLCLDRFLVRREVADPEAEGALTHLIKGLDAALHEVVLGPGDLLFLDNRKAVHGRSPFVPRYDGTDRWLKRVGVTSDLRRSRTRRSSVEDRVIG